MQTLAIHSNETRKLALPAGWWLLPCIALGTGVWATVITSLLF